MTINVMLVWVSAERVGYTLETIKKWRSTESSNHHESTSVCVVLPQVLEQDYSTRLVGSLHGAGFVSLQVLSAALILQGQQWLRPRLTQSLPEHTPQRSEQQVSPDGS